MAIRAPDGANKIKATSFVPKEKRSVKLSGEGAICDFEEKNALVD